MKTFMSKLFLIVLLFCSVSVASTNAQGRDTSQLVPVNLLISNCELSGQSSYFIVEIRTENGDFVFGKGISVGRGSTMDLGVIRLEKGVYTFFVDAEGSARALDMTINVGSQGSEEAYLTAIYDGHSFHDSFYEEF